MVLSTGSLTRTERGGEEDFKANPITKKLKRVFYREIYYMYVGPFSVMKKWALWRKSRNEIDHGD